MSIRLINGAFVHEPTVTTRIWMQRRPPGTPSMYQHWGSLLFMHWPISIGSLRPLVPEPLQIDTHGGIAWIGVTPFTRWGIRPPYLPAVPVLSSSYELNVRTYVHYEGVPGIWFLSVDASNLFAVAGARWAYSLPYFQAKMSVRRDHDATHFAAKSTHARVPHAGIDVAWVPGELVAPLDPEGLEFFLTERYCLYTSSNGLLQMARIHHNTWRLNRAKLLRFQSSMLQAVSLPEPGPPALVHAQSEPLHVEIWPLRPVEEAQLPKAQATYRRFAYSP